MGMVLGLDTVFSAFNGKSIAAVLSIIIQTSGKGVSNKENNNKNSEK